MKKWGIALLLFVSSHIALATRIDDTEPVCRSFPAVTQICGVAGQLLGVVRKQGMIGLKMQASRWIYEISQYEYEDWAQFMNACVEGYFQYND